MKKMVNLMFSRYMKKQSCHQSLDKYNAIHLPKYIKCKICDQKYLLDNDKWNLHVGFEANQADANVWSWLKSQLHRLNLHRSTLRQRTAVFMFCILVQWAVQILGDPQEYKRAKQQEQSTITPSDSTVQYFAHKFGMMLL